MSASLSLRWNVLAVRGQLSDAHRRPIQIQKTPVVPEEETTMYDIFTAILLADHLSRRHFENWRKPETPCETESPWARVFAWQRRGANPRV